MNQGKQRSWPAFLLGLPAGSAVGLAVAIWWQPNEAPRNADDTAAAKPIVGRPTPVAAVEAERTNRAAAGRTMPVVSPSSIDPARWKFPDFRNAYRAREKFRLAALFQDYFARNFCDARTREQVLELAVSQLTAHADARLVLPDADPASPEFIQALDATARPIMEKLRQLLGETRFEAFVRYEHSLPYRIEIQGFQRALSEADALSPENYDALLRHTQESRSRFAPAFGRVEPEAAMLQAMEAADREIELAMTGRLNGRQMEALRKVHLEKRKLALIHRQLDEKRAIASTR